MAVIIQQEDAFSRHQLVLTKSRLTEKCLKTNLWSFVTTNLPAKPGNNLCFCFHSRHSAHVAIYLFIYIFFNVSCLSKKKKKIWLKCSCPCPFLYLLHSNGYAVSWIPSTSMNKYLSTLQLHFVRANLLATFFVCSFVR